jgi:hypothetical protein
VESSEQSSTQGQTFQWHPTYKGRDVDQVRRDLAGEIGRDQRQYQLSLEGAEQSEFDSLSSVVELERRWGHFDFDWAETDPKELADRIIAFELDRDNRRELISFADYRVELDDTGEEVTPEFAWKTKPVLITAGLGIIALIVILAIAL